ncbi:MAG: ABC transporter permease subunit [Candidatus Helarchaeota archaeon]
MLRKAIIVMKKDLKEIKTSFQIIGAMIALPAIFVGIALITFGFIFAYVPNINDLYSILYGDYDFIAMYNVMFLMIPIIIPTYIAADSFVGEKIRKTIEALLIAPISDMELLLGKILVSLVPTLLITYAFTGIYILGVYILQWIFYSSIVFSFPDLGFVFGILLHSALFCILTIEIMVVISLKVKGIREAQQIGGILVIPIMALMFLPLLGLNIYNFSYMPNIILFTLFTVIFIGIDLLMYFLMVKIFQRSNIITKI